MTRTEWAVVSSAVGAIVAGLLVLVVDKLLS